MTQKGYIALADGTAFPGKLFGAEGTRVGEAVFTTGMTGYQEVITDPSYCEQIVCLTSPQIGNTGVTRFDDESAKPYLAGLIVHELSSKVSNWRATQSLSDYLIEQNIVAMSDIDTRSLTRHIRDHGAQMACIGSEPVDTMVDRARSAQPMIGRDLTGVVSTQAEYVWTEGNGEWALPSPKSTHRFSVAAVDYGIKRGILRCLVDAGCDVTVFPAHTSAEQLLKHDGVFLSNGPGDPEAVDISVIKAILGKTPLFGICLGHQLLCRALSGTTSKLKFGHRGLNQPVQDLKTGKVEITTQNHGFVVDIGSLQGECKATHKHLNDGSCEGMEHLSTGAFSVQYHPEAAAGPHDAHYLFDRFVKQMAAAQ